MQSTHPKPADTHPPPIDADLVEQATPGYGIPSQDPRQGAQTALSPEDAERESQSVLMGGGMMAGAAAGAAVGVAVAGPVGVLVGGTVGGIAGALGGAAAGTAATPEEAREPPAPVDKGPGPRARREG